MRLLNLKDCLIKLGISNLSSLLGETLVEQSSTNTPKHVQIDQ